MAYAIYKIDFNTIKTPEEYEKVITAQPSFVCNTLSEAQKHCGHLLRRQRYGYSGMTGNIEYIALKIS